MSPNAKKTKLAGFFGGMGPAGNYFQNFLGPPIPCLLRLTEHLPTRWVDNCISAPRPLPFAKPCGKMHARMSGQAGGLNSIGEDRRYKSPARDVTSDYRRLLRTLVSRARRL